MQNPIRNPDCHPSRSYYAKGQCRNCYERALRSRNSAFTQRQRQNSKTWANTHKDRKKQLDKKYRDFHKERFKLTQQANKLAWLNLNIDKAQELLAFQKNRCAICGGNPTHKRSFDLDHCHETAQVRGFLCGKCNMGLGMFDDNKEFLRKALSFLQHPPAKALWG